jgi:ABC-type lipoprotein export system ATPase subunit
MGTMKDVSPVRTVLQLGDNAMARFRNTRIGYIFQFASLLPTLRAIDNVALPALLGRDSAAADTYERAAQLLTDLGLGSHFDAYPSEMSAGEQRRTAIARALINDPLLLLADEPTSDLDVETESEIMALLLKVNRERGTALMLVTHNLALASEAAQVVHIVDGAIVP